MERFIVAAALWTAASLAGCGSGSRSNLENAGASTAPASCTPATCDSKAVACGVTSDGCGGTVDCGTCASLSPAAGVSARDLGAGCAGVTLAALPRSVSITEQLPAKAQVAVGTSDGSGHIAVGYGDDQFEWHWRMLDAGGHELGTASGRDMYELVPIADGFDTSVLTSDGANQGLEVQRLGGDGRLVRATPVVEAQGSMLASIAWRMAEGSSGPVVATPIVPFTGNHKPEIPVWSIRDQNATATNVGWLDTDIAGTFVGVTSVPDGSVFGLSVFSRYVVGAWFDASAPVAAGQFSADYLDFGGFPSQLAALSDGTIVLGNDQRWFTHAATRKNGLVPAPEWLQEVPATRIERLSNGRGYVILPLSADPNGCLYRVQLRDASGALCQTLQIDGDPNACEPDSLRVGADGTLLQLHSRSCTDAGCTVERRFWPRVFAATSE